MPDIQKSSRHSKITGDFAEGLVLYWLSKHGFECAKVDHTGIDLIARNPLTNELMGISVKSRSRSDGTEKDGMNIPNADFRKVDVACRAFGCEPYFAIVIDGANSMKIFILSKSKLIEMFPPGKVVSIWKMGDNYLKSYKEDKTIIIIEFSYETLNWWH